MNSIIEYMKRSYWKLCLILLMISMFCLIYPAHVMAQQTGDDQTDNPVKTLTTEVNIRIISAELTRFEKPIDLSVGREELIYREALVFKVTVNREQFDSLPPSIDPFLYIGKEEYRIFHIDRKDNSQELILTFHILDWNKLEEGVPVVLTIAHGEPVRNSRTFYRQDIPLFTKSMVRDKR